MRSPWHHSVQVPVYISNIPIRVASNRLTSLSGPAPVALSPFAAWPLAVAFLVRRKWFTWRGNLVLVPALMGGMFVGWLIERGIYWMLPAGHSALRKLFQ